MNSGAEAVETNYRVARRWGAIVREKAFQQEALVIVCDGNF